MLRLPVLLGVIRRRILLNFRVDLEVLAELLPSSFRPKAHHGFGMAGICLIRLAGVRPQWMPEGMGISSENAAHRIAVIPRPGKSDHAEGVYIPRRDTGSLLNHLAGGRLFPGEHHFSDFNVEDTGGNISMDVKARDGGMTLKLRANEGDQMPATSCFSSLEEASAFFAAGKVGWSVTKDCCVLDAVRLEIANWVVKPLEVTEVESSFFSDTNQFPEGSVAFDHALIMRNISHYWHGEPNMSLQNSEQRETT